MSPPRRRSFFALRHPAQYVVVAFVGASLIGGGLLRLPAAHEQGATTSFVDALFTATSAVCVTGLTVVDTASHWSTLGEWIILALIQVGGFGIMAITSLVLLVLSRRIGLRQRLIAAAESGAGIGDVRWVLVRVAIFSLSCEAVAASILFLRFWLTHDFPVGRAAYLGIFHAVSSFNNAGFALFRDNLMGFADDPVVLLVIAVSVIVGGLGFPVWVQIARNPRRPQRWNVHAKLTVSTTLALLAGGWVLLAWFEWTNTKTLGAMAAHDSLVNALFHSVQPRTAGFNSMDIASMRDQSQLLTEVLMFIGGGSASTAGGIKVTTFAVLGWVIWAEARGDPDVVVFERRMPEAIQRQALTVALLAVGFVVAATMLLVTISDFERGDLLFEVISALGTVGLSTGITGDLQPGAELVIAALMILGRVGPPTLFAALVLRERDRLYRHPEERPIIG